MALEPRIVAAPELRATRALNDPLEGGIYPQATSMANILGQQLGDIHVHDGESQTRTQRHLKGVLRGTLATLMTGFAVSLLLAGGQVPISYIYPVRAGVAGPFTLAHGNLGLLLLDVTGMLASILLFCTLPDLHVVNYHFLDTRLASARLVVGTKCASWVGFAGLILGAAGNFAARFTLSWEDPGPTIYPQDLSFLGFGIAAVMFGSLGIARASFVPRPLGVRMVATGFLTICLVLAKAVLDLSLILLPGITSAMAMGVGAWIVSYFRAFLKHQQGAGHPRAELTGTDLHDQWVLSILGIRTPDQLAQEDPRELAEILDAPTWLIQEWVYNLQGVHVPLYPLVNGLEETVPLLKLKAS